MLGGYLRGAARKGGVERYMADALGSSAANLGGMAGASKSLRDKTTKRDVGKHIARFILVGLYTGTRHAAICGAAFHPAIGRGHVDLERGVFIGERREPARPKSANRL